MKKTIQLIVLILIFSCNNSEKKNNDKTQNDNVESTKNSEWVELIQPNSLAGWHYFQDDGNKTGWDLNDGV